MLTKWSAWSTPHLISMKHDIDQELRSRTPIGSVEGSPSAAVTPVSAAEGRATDRQTTEVWAEIRALAQRIEALEPQKWDRLNNNKEQQ